jgi:hypothetical protein
MVLVIIRKDYQDLSDLTVRVKDREVLNFPPPKLERTRSELLHKSEDSTDSIYPVDSRHMGRT